jgi:hypothetical protein
MGWKFQWETESLEKGLCEALKEMTNVMIFEFFLMVKSPAADATDALQPWGLLCNPMMKMKMMIIFCPLPSNGAPVEWNWQGKTEEVGEKPVPVPLCPPQIPRGLTANPGLRGGRPAANRLSHGTAFSSLYRSQHPSNTTLWISRFHNIYCNMFRLTYAAIIRQSYKFKKEKKRI